MIRNAQPLPWRSKGLSDSLDGSTSFSGAMASLQNLIPDPSTAQLWQCRPAAVIKTTFPGLIAGGFSPGFSPGFAVAGVPTTVGTITALKVIGTIAYGMIGHADGFDHPFAYDLANNVMLTISGDTSMNTPLSQPITGSWIPPIMDLIGNKLVVTHIGFQVTTSFIGWFDLSTPTAPVWHAGNTTGTQLFTVPPIGVAQFGNRAYYIHNAPGAPALIFSDILNATNNGTGGIVPVITLGDAAPISALGQLRFYNQLGGIIQGLVAFKGVSNSYQITGDAATNNLAVNAMNLATGTLAPLSVISTPRGLGFISPDGFRIIDFQSNISDPIGINGQGVVAPFQYTAQPSRIAAACNGNIIRISNQNAQAANAPIQEYWLDLGRQIWHGPHTFPASVIQPFMGTFILAAPSIPGYLWQSDPVQNATSVFVENTVQMQWQYRTTFLPDTDQMSNNNIGETLLDAQLGPNAPITVSVTDQNGAVVDTVSIMQSGTGSVWGQFQWGQAPWGAAATALAPRQLQWHGPIVVAKAQYQAVGNSNASLRLGAWHFRYEELKYLTDITAAA